MLLEEDTECFAFLAGHESFAAAEGAIGIAEKANKVRQKPLRVILNGLGKDAAMRAALEIGDQVVTIGGIVGRVVAIKDDTFVLETGSDRVKIRFTKNAISSVEKLNMDNAPANAKK